MASFQPKRLQQARYLRKKSLADLGVDVDITRQSLSQFERGERSPLPENVFKLAEALSVPVEFFLRPIGPVESSPRTLVHYRALRKTRDLIREQQRASAILDLCAATIDTLQEHVEYQPARVPEIDHGVDVLKLHDEDIEDVASATRRALGLGDGPLSDVALLVENLSIPVVQTSLPEGMDGMSAWYGDKPFIVVSSEASYSRGRLNVAHEFGHLVLHHYVTEDPELDEETFKLVEHQAWRFAGALLLPASSFMSELYKVSLDALVLLKQKWGVSIAGMIRRLQDLCVIDSAQAKSLHIELRRRQWHRTEPLDDRERERGRLINRTATFLAENSSISIPDLAAESKLPRAFFADALEVSVDELLPPPPKNVVQFKLRQV